MQLQGDGTAVVHRTADTFKAAVTALVPLNSHYRRQDQKIDPEKAPERLLGR